MLYKLLGMAVWNGGKLFLRRKYGRTYVPKPVIAGGAAAIALGATAVAFGRGRSSE